MSFLAFCFFVTLTAYPFAGVVARLAPPRARPRLAVVWVILLAALTLWMV